MKRVMRHGLWMGLLLPAVMLLGQSATPVEPRPLPAQSPVHTALMQVDRPAGADDAIWQREIGTYAVRMRSTPVLQSALASEEVRGLKEKALTGVMDSVEKFGATVQVGIEPGTALIRIQANCSNDASVNAKVANAVAQACMMMLQDAAEQNKQRRNLSEALKMAEDRYAMQMEAFLDYVKRRGTDRPLPPDASAETQEVRVMNLRQVKAREAEVQESLLQVNELRRRLTALELPVAVPVHIIQQAL